MHRPSEDIMPAVERVMRQIEDTPGANGMFIAVTWDEEAQKILVEMRSHWTLLICADAAVRSMLEGLIEAVEPHADENDEARDYLGRCMAARDLIGGAKPVNTEFFDVALPEDLN
jgi:hypothetical protein